MSRIAADVPIDELLAGFGLTGEAAADARRILEDEGLTNPRKQRIATAKTTLALDAIDRRVQRLCRSCEPRAAADGRPVVRVPPAFCTSCGGSNNARAVAELTAACRETGIERLLVVGGSPNMRAGARGARRRRARAPPGRRHEEPEPPGRAGQHRLGRPDRRPRRDPTRAQGLDPLHPRPGRPPEARHHEPPRAGGDRG